MMTTKVFKKARRVYPRAEPLMEHTLFFRFLSPYELTGMSVIPDVIKDAVRNPGEVITRYFERDNFEYETRAIYNSRDNTVVTNEPCPFWQFHNQVSQCDICEWKN